MDAIKLVPQLFYDVISRVIPGVMALVLIAAALGRDLGAMVVGPFAGAPALQGSALFLSVAVIGAAYIVGQLLGPVSDFFERRIASVFVPRSYWLRPEALARGGRYPASMRRLLLAELELADDGDAGAGERLTATIFLWYDWLRVWQPEAGARVEKLRAQYRMFGGIAVAAFFAAFAHVLVHVLGAGRFAPDFVAAALAMALFSSWGMVRMYRTFQWSVLNQYFVSRAGAAAAGGPASGVPAGAAPTGDAAGGSALAPKP
ncbi:MAG TPA: hypothetical protein VFQ38_05315 [Longimicrobiales bacterium]|nr:hypothetical protein [Longimicrobiales bacterium]